MSSSGKVELIILNQEVYLDSRICIKVIKLKHNTSVDFNDALLSFYRPYPFVNNCWEIEASVCNK